MQQNESGVKQEIPRKRRRIYETPVDSLHEDDNSQNLNDEQVVEESVTTQVSQDRLDEDEGARLMKADKIIRRYMYMAGGIGLIPSVILDITSLTAAQMAMINELAALYLIPGNKIRNQPIVVSTVSALITQGLMHTKLILALKMIPMIGMITDFLFYPAIASAITYATGKTFVAHFEEGGTLNEFNPKAMKKVFKKNLKTAPKMA